MKTYKILVLEDDLSALSVITNRLFQIEKIMQSNNVGDIAVTVLSEYTQVEEYANSTKQEFDLVLLDRDCRACGSFHVLDFKKFDPNKVIVISTYPEYNKAALGLGLRKDYEKIEEWGDELLELVRIKLNISHEE
jgi:hypothetical protein